MGKRGWRTGVHRLNDARISERWLCVLILAATAASLIPVILLGMYNTPCADDYSYGRVSHQVWQETGSLWNAMWAVILDIKRWYNGWQGTFSAIFLMSLQPASFGDGLYRLVPAMMISGLAIGELFFSWALFRKTLGATRRQFLMLGSLWLFLSVQFAPSAVEAFYWYNGAVYYTGFFSISLIYFGLLLHCRTLTSCGRLWGETVLLCVLGIILGGGELCDRTALAAAYGASAPVAGGQAGSALDQCADSNGAAALRVSC